MKPRPQRAAVHHLHVPGNGANARVAEVTHRQPECVAGQTRVRVHAQHERGRGGRQPGVQRARLAGVGLANDAHRRRAVRSLERARPLVRVIGRSIVDHEDLVRVPLELEQTGDSRLDDGTLVVRRHEDRDGGIRTRDEERGRRVDVVQVAEPQQHHVSDDQENQEGEQEGDAEAQHHALRLDREAGVEPEDRGRDDEQRDRDRRGVGEPATCDHGVLTRMRKLPPHR